jgi:hypothetical protein
MNKTTDAYVFDTSAWLTLIEDEKQELTQYKSF